MQNTESFNLQKPDYNNIVDVMVLNQNFDRIDKGLVLNAGYSTGDNNTYVLTVPDIEDLTEEDIGASFKFFAHKDSTDVVSIKLNSMDAKPLYDGKKRQVKKIYKDVPYTIVWDGFRNFFLGSSGSMLDSDSVTATEKDVLINKTYIGSDEEIHTGTMPELGATTYIPTTTDIIIPSGQYLSGNQTIKGDANLKPENIVKGKGLFGVNGSATVESLGGKYYKTGISTCTKSETEFITNIAQYLSFTPRIIVGYVNTSIGVKYFYWNNTPGEKVLLFYVDAFREFAGYTTRTDGLNASSITVFSSGNENVTDVHWTAIS